MALIERLQRLAPDFSTTIRRFPFATLHLLALTVLIILMANEVLPQTSEDGFARLAGGLAVGAVLAAAGRLYAEARPDVGWATRAIAFLPSLLVLALFQIPDEILFVPYFLPAIALLWLSLSISIGATDRHGGGQSLYWSTNARAISTASVALVAGIMVVAGLVAIGWSLERLFSLRINWIFQRWLLPSVTLLLIPLYWLSTAPSAHDRWSAEPVADDFLTRAIASIGQFVLVPFILVYALILHAYAIQIVLQWSLPDGVLASMVLFFQFAGLLTWLLVYPPFLRNRVPVNIFRRSWFALSIVPLILFALAVWTRVDAYGLTPSRVLLIIFGLWVAAVVAINVATGGRADIRFIPASAAIVLVLASIWPFTPDNLSRWHQSTRLQALIGTAVVDGRPQWEDDDRQQALAAIDYLAFHEDNRALLADIARRAGVDMGEGVADIATIRERLDLVRGPLDTTEGVTHSALALTGIDTALDLGATPYLLGWTRAGARYDGRFSDALTLSIEGQDLVLQREADTLARADMASWLARQQETQIVDPMLTMEADGIALALIVQDIGYQVAASSGAITVDYIEVQLFAGAPEL